MSYSYINDIKPLQDAGVSNAEIAQHISDRTANPMYPSQSEYILQDSGAVLVDPVSGEKFGSLIDYYQTLPAGDSKNLIAFFLDRIYSGNIVETSEYPRSIQFAAVELTLPADLQAVCQKLVDEANARPDQGTTEADVVAAQAAYEAEQAEIAEQERIDGEVQALYERYLVQYNSQLAPLLDSKETDELVWQAAIRAMSDNFIPAE